MDNLVSLAKWWTSEAPAQALGKNRVCAPMLADLFDDNVSGYQMDPFMDDVDHRVVLKLEESLQSATPLYRHTLINEISEAIAVYRNTETLSVLNDLAVFAPLIVSYRKPSVFICGLRAHAPFSSVWNWLEASSTELLAEAFAVVTATAQLDGTDAVINSFELDQPDPSEQQLVYLKDPALVELIRSNKSSLLDIIDICKDSPGIGSDLLLTRLSAKEKALRDGIL